MRQNPQIITADELRQIDRNNGFIIEAAGHRFGGPRYMLPRREWVEREFAPAFRKHLVALGVQRWREGVWDCNLFALGTKFLASVFHANTPEAADCQLAVAETWYQNPGRGGYHASGLFTCEGGLPVFFEGDTLETRVATRQEAFSADLLNR